MGIAGRVERLLTARVAGGLVLGVLVGLAQARIDVAGMQAAGRVEGLAGIGVAATWAAIYLGVSLVLLLVACRLLQVPLWAAAALGLLLGQLAVVAVLWDAVVHLGMHGDARAALFPVTAALLLVVVALLPARHPVA